MLEELRNQILKELEECDNVVILNCVLTMLKTVNDNTQKIVNRPYTIQEAADELEVTPQTIRAYIHQGKLKAKRQSDKKFSKFLIDKKDLMDFMDKYIYANNIEGE